MAQAVEKRVRHAFGTLTIIGAALTGLGLLLAAAIYWFGRRPSRKLSRS